MFCISQTDTVKAAPLPAPIGRGGAAIVHSLAYITNTVKAEQTNRHLSLSFSSAEMNRLCLRSGARLAARGVGAEVAELRAQPRAPQEPQPLQLLHRRLVTVRLHLHELYLIKNNRHN